MWAELSSIVSQSTRFTDGRTDRRLSRGYTVHCITCSRTVNLIGLYRSMLTEPRPCLRELRVYPVEMLDFFCCVKIML